MDELFFQYVFSKTTLNSQRNPHHVGGFTSSVLFLKSCHSDSQNESQNKQNPLGGRCQFPMDIDSLLYAYSLLHEKKTSQVLRSIINKTVCLTMSELVIINNGNTHVCKKSNSSSQKGSGKVQFFEAVEYYYIIFFKNKIIELNRIVKPCAPLLQILLWVRYNPGWVLLLWITWASDSIKDKIVSVRAWSPNMS